MNQALASILLMAARELEPSLQRIHRPSVPFVSPLFDDLRREIAIAELMNCFGRRNRNDSRNINITAFLHGLVSRIVLEGITSRKFFERLNQFGNLIDPA